MGKKDLNANVHLNISELPTLKCKTCNSYVFSATFILKKVSSLISPTGKETLAPIQVFSCNNCGALMPIGDEDKDVIGGIENEEPETKENIIDTKLVN